MPYPPDCDLRIIRPRFDSKQQPMPHILRRLIATLYMYYYSEVLL